MANKIREEGGFTLAELLITMTIFSLISAGLYASLFASSDGAQTTAALEEVTDEARRGFNRLIRDTREGQEIEVSDDRLSYTIRVDFDGDGSFEPDPLDSAGSYEVLEYEFNPSVGGDFDGTVTVSNGLTPPEVLIASVDCIRKANNTCYDPFVFASSNLTYDTSPVGGDGVTSYLELDTSPSVGNNNGLIDGDELKFIDRVSVALRISIDGSGDTFYGEAEMRNQR